jgi:hypothetical protein
MSIGEVQKADLSVILLARFTTTQVRYFTRSVFR